MIKFLLTPFLLITSTVLVSLDINYIPTFVFVYSLFIIFGDLLLPRDHKVYDDDSKQLFDFFVMLPLPLLLMYLFVSSNVFYDKYLLNELSYYSIIGNVINLGLMLATAGTNAGHELIHRAKNSIQQKVGYWLLALNFDTAFVIEHLHGHHKFVGTYDDPATARYNENTYVFIVRSTIGTLKNAWVYEKNRMIRKNKSIFSLSNQLITGFLKGLTIVAIVYFIGREIGLVMYFLSIIVAKILLETVNYIEHYGLTRELGTPVLPKHSWNTNRWVSSNLLYNLSRHSAHHEKANIPYWKLNPYQDAPEMPLGYLSMVYIAILAPSIFKKIMKPRVIKWSQSI
tara:strand:+ start:50 stop:1072 length:1023 start_codon:yes stop_codon:yes gene_type:complete